MGQMELKRKRTLVIAAIIWMVNRIVMTNLIGESGIGYLAAAQECFLLFFIITIYSIPEAMAKLMRIRIQKGQAKNARKLFQCVFALSLFYLLIGAVIFWGLSELLMGRVFASPLSTFTFKMLFPTYALGVFIQIYRGYFQGMGSMVPTMISKIMNSFMAFVGCIAFTLLLLNYGEKVSKLLLNEEFKAEFGSTGVVIGFIPAALFVLFFLIFLYFTNKRNLNKIINKDSGRNTENVGEMIYVLLLTMIPNILIALFVLAPNAVGMIIYNHLVVKETVAGFVTYGTYYGQYLPIVFILVFLIYLLGCSLGNSVVVCFKREEYRHAKERLSAGLHYAVVTGAFLTGMVLVLAEPILNMLFGAATKEGIWMLQIGSVMILLGICTIFVINVLLGIGRHKTVILNSAISFVAYIIGCILFVRLFKWGISGIIGAWILQMLLLLFLNSFMLMRNIKFKIEWIYAFAIPGGTAILTSIIMMLLSKALISLVGSILTVVIAVFVGVFVNLMMLLALRGFKETELKLFPGGAIIKKIGTLLHLL